MSAILKDTFEENSTVAAGPAANGASKKTLRQKIREREELTEGTGHYYGVQEFKLRERDPLKYERFYSRLQAACMAAREVARYVAASPGGREMGEAVWGLATAEGDSLALSEGFVAHSVAFPVAIRFMSDHGYEENPGFHDGDVYVSDDGPTCGAPHPGDTYTYVPIVHDGELIGWACAINHIMEVGAPQAGSWPMFAVDTYMDGFLVPPTRTGENLKQYAWWNEMWKRRTRAGMMNILDDKMRLAGCAMMLRAVHEIIAEFGLDYYQQATREVIEESRRMVMDNIRNWMVPGVYEQAAFRICKYKGLQNIWAHADKDTVIHVHLKVCIDERGRLECDMEGSSRWGFHAFNAYPGGTSVAQMMALAGALGHNCKFTSGGNLTVTKKAPLGSIFNPDTTIAAHTNAWAQMMQISVMSYATLSRSMFMRGYAEESFAVSGPWDAVQGDGVLSDGTTYGYTNFELLGACAHGAYAYRDGEPAVWFIASQLCNMGNSEEFEYLVPPFFHLGRKLEPGACGHGKYRGGIGLTTVHWVKEPGQRLSASRAGSACAFFTENALGMFGGYPCPGAVTAVAKGTNLPDLIAAGDTPRTLSEVVGYARDGRLKAKHLAVWKSDAPETTLEENDLWAQLAGMGGGWGDPLERKPALVLQDVQTGQAPPDFAQALYAVVLISDSEGGYSLDVAATESRRAMLREQRRLQSIPVKGWWSMHRIRILGKEFPEPIVDMYRSSTSFDAYERHYREFWQLPDDFRW